MKKKTILKILIPTIIIALIILFFLIIISNIIRNYLLEEYISEISFKQALFNYNDNISVTTVSTINDYTGSSTYTGNDAKELIIYDRILNNDFSILNYAFAISSDDTHYIIKYKDTITYVNKSTGFVEKVDVPIMNATTTYTIQTNENAN